MTFWSSTRKVVSSSCKIYRKRCAKRCGTLTSASSNPLSNRRSERNEWLPRITYPFMDRTHPVFSGSCKMTGHLSYPVFGERDEASMVGVDNTAEEPLLKKELTSAIIQCSKSRGFSPVSNPTLRSNSLALTERSHDALGVSDRHRSV